jgi:hypothetical protein
MSRSDRSPALPTTRLVDVLRQLPERELESLVLRLKIRIDEAKRIDVPSQVARSLVQLPELRDPGLLPGPTRELLYRIAEARGVLPAQSLPAAVEPLVARGVVFVRGGADGMDLLLPSAHLLVLRSWEGEDPRGVRALLNQLNPDVAASVASHYLGRPATPPVALCLEPAWEVLSEPSRLAAEIEDLAPLERKLLLAIDHVGGEVDTEELLDLEREPMRLRGATGATPSRRGVGFALERRGLLVPVHPNRHVIPTEVAQLVGAQRRAEREAQRHEIRSFVLGEDHAPRRARFVEDPAPLALAMALLVRDPAVEVRPGVGTPRSLVAKFAARFGRDVETVGFIAALSRAVGLWDPSAVGLASSPGALEVQDLGRALFEAWRRGGVWDEARPDHEVLRAPPEAREPSSVGVVRELVLEALRELSDGRWAPWEAVAAYVRSDSRTPGVARLLERWAQRGGFAAVSPLEVARRIALESLHALGMLDIGDADESDASALGPTLRITPRGRAYLADAPESRRGAEPSRFLDNQAIRVGRGAKVGTVVAIAPFVEIGGVAGALDLFVTPQAVSHALSAGFEADVIRSRIEQLAALPDPILRLLTQASAVIGRGEFVPTVGFFWVDDPEIRELLSTRRQTADLFVDPSPPGGLLIAAGVDLDRLVRRCRTLGVEVVVEGAARRTDSSGTLPALRSSRAPSSARLPATRSVTPRPLKRSGD